MSSLVRKFKDMWIPPEDEYDDYDYQESDDQDEMIQDDRESVRKSESKRENSKVVNIHATANLQVVLFKPERFGEETREIAEEK